MKRLPPPPTLTLGTEEINLVLAYRAMDQRHQGQSMQMMTCYADKYPARARQELRLVRGGAK